LVKYSGELNSLEATFPVTMDLTKFDVSYEYYRVGDDTPIQEDGKNAEGVYDAGEYMVKAVFTVKDPNYEDIAPMEAKLMVGKKEISVSEFAFSDTTLIYNGEGQKPTFSVGNSEGVTFGEVSVFAIDGDGYKEIEKAVDAGAYRAKVTVSLNDPENYVFGNGRSSIELSCDFTITEAEIAE
jgi:hypothetical protein